MKCQSLLNGFMTIVAIVKIDEMREDKQMKMKTIPLSQGLFAMVDDKDFEKLNQHKWSACKDGNTYYAARHIKKEDGTRATLRMHQEIIGKKFGYVIDHQDGMA